MEINVENSVESRKRAPNFSESEIRLFVDVILPQHKDSIENKKSDAVTRAEKSVAWEALTKDFNASSTNCHRTVLNMKNLWDKLKKNARKAKATERIQVFATGRGKRIEWAEPTLTDLRVLEVSRPSGFGLINHCDGDAAYSSEFDVVETDSQETILLEDVSSPLAAGEATWGEVVPRMLYNKKPEALRAGAGSDSCSVSMVSGSSSSSESSRKKSLLEEMEWAKACKRRRPHLPVSLNESQAQLMKAKIELATVTKEKLREESVILREEERRKEELFQIEKKKNDAEAELVILQVLKMKRDLGLE